jgi:hypothetical protein
MTYVANTPAYELLFGGTNASQGNNPGSVLGDLWYYGLSGSINGTWGLLCPTGGNSACAPYGAPTPRWGAVFTYVDGWTLLFGGCSSPPTFWEVAGPSSGSSSGEAVGNASPATVTQYPGNCSTPSSILGDTWEWVTSVTSSGIPTGFWQEIAPAGAACPQPRYEASASAQNPFAGNGATLAVMFGGINGSFDALSDTWVITTPRSLFTSCAKSGPWAKLYFASPPPARFGAQFSYDEDVDDLSLGDYVLFGGASPQAPGGLKSPFMDTWTLICNGAGVGCTWFLDNPLVFPEARCFGGLAWDPVSTSGQLLLYGGVGVFNDNLYGCDVQTIAGFLNLWVYTIGNDTWYNATSGSGPVGRGWFAFASDAVNSETYVLGGWSDGFYAQANFWEY